MCPSALFDTLVDSLDDKETKLLKEVAEGQKDSWEAARLLRPTYIRNGPGAKKIDNAANETFEFYRDLFVWNNRQHDTEMLQDSALELKRLWDRVDSCEEVLDADVHTVEDNG